MNVESWEATACLDADELRDVLAGRSKTRFVFWGKPVDPTKLKITDCQFCAEARKVILEVVVEGCSAPDGAFGLVGKRIEEQEDER